MALSRYVAAISVIDENDLTVGQCEPGGVAVIWVRLLIWVISVYLYQRVTLVLIGVVAG